MNTPDFLVIGAKRCGTSWLDKQLRKHPDIYLPQKRKEIQFFDLYYERGWDWYQSFFPVEQEVNSSGCIGEVTPNYIYVPKVPELIYKHLPNCKLILMLRNPVDRLYSQYGFKIRNEAYTGTFQEYLQQSEVPFKRGFYGSQVERYLQYFDPEQLLVLVFEEVMKQPRTELMKIFEFLSLDPSKFDFDDVGKKINHSYRVRFAKSLALANSFVKWLRQNDLDWIYNLGYSMGIRKELFGVKEELRKIEPDIRRELLLMYENDIHLLERLAGRDFSVWQ